MKDGQGWAGLLQLLPAAASAPVAAPPTRLLSPWRRFERDQLGGRARELQYGGLTLELGEQRGQSTVGCRRGALPQRAASGG